MLTPFGKLVREYRAENNQFLKNMADSLGTSAAYISAMEMGKKSIPDGFVDKVAAYLGVDNVGLQQLKEAAERSSKRLEVANKKLDWEQRNLVNAFARKLESGDISVEKGHKWLENIQE